ncbi:hypothetical protein GA0115259_109197 [Streptomyces sp. MnatMP-M17]|nr:hypothetical protein GA0115259_109197 [Streptomyces sp. MnatMP-M17]
MGPGPRHRCPQNTGQAPGSGPIRTGRTSVPVSGPAFQAKAPSTFTERVDGASPYPQNDGDPQFGWLREQTGVDVVNPSGGPGFQSRFRRLWKLTLRS